MYWRLIININICSYILLSANLLQSQTDGLGALYRTDEFALAYSLFNDVTKVFKELEKKKRKEKEKSKLVMIITVFN